MNKQIEEMTFDLCMIDRCKRLPRAECNNTTCAHCEADALYNAGYRLASEVAREIFEDIEKITTHGIWLTSMSEVAFAELKKKHTEGEGNG